ncbi:MAG TPA: hypothetical protein ENN43_07500 [bacterium]|nr:hypothetical protein [bacterium]
MADTASNRIRRVDLTLNTVATMVSSGLSVPSGLAIDSNTSPERLYFSDSGSNRIMYMAIPGNTVHYVAGSVLGFADGNSATARFRVPMAIALNEEKDRLYAADMANNKVRVIDLQDSTVSTLAGGGGAESITAGYLNGYGTDALFDRPRGISVKSGGGIFITDYFNNMIRLVEPQSNSLVTRYAGYSKYDGDGNYVPAATFNSPGDACINTLNGRVYVTDTYNCVIRMIDETGLISTIAGTGTCGYADGPGNEAMFMYPRMSVVDAVNGYLYVVDTGSHVIRRIDFNSPDYEVSLTAGTPGVSGYVNGQGGAARFFSPEAVVLDYVNNILYVADTRNNRIRSIDLNNANQTALVAGNGVAGYADNNSGANAAFNNPSGITWSEGFNSVFIGDTNNNLIRRIVLTGTYPVSTVAGSGAYGFADGEVSAAMFRSPRGMAMDDKLKVLYAADSLNYMIRFVDINTYTVGTVAGDGTSGYAEGTGLSARFGSISQLSINEEAQVLYTADTLSNRIRMVDVFIPTPTPTLTHTETPTHTPTITMTVDGTVTDTPTVTETATITETHTETPYLSPTDTPTVSPSPSVTATVTPTGTATTTASYTQTATNSPTFTESPSATETHTATLSATATQTGSQTPSNTISPTVTETGTVTETLTHTPTQTETPVFTDTPVFSATVTVSETLSATASYTATPAASLTFTHTPTSEHTLTGTATPEPSFTASPEPTLEEQHSATASASVTAYITPDASGTPSSTFTQSATAVSTPSRTVTPVPTETVVSGATPTVTPTRVDYYGEGFYLIDNHRLYPNPSIGRVVTIEFSANQNTQSAVIEIYTMSFRLIQKHDLGPVPANVTVKKHITSLRNMANGTYYYRIKCLNAEGKEANKTGQLIIIK